MKITHLCKAVFKYLLVPSIILFLLGVVGIFLLSFLPIGHPAAKRFEAKYKPKFERTVEGAVATKNPALCKTLIEKKYFATDWDCDGCYTRYYQNDCFSEYVKVYLGPEVCLTFSEGRSTVAPGAYHEDYFDKESCIQYVTKRLKDPAYCEYMSDLHEQIACRAVAMRDLFLCFEKHVDKPETCVKEIGPNRNAACRTLLQNAKETEFYREIQSFCDRTTIAENMTYCRDSKNSFMTLEIFEKDRREGILPEKMRLCYEKIYDPQKPYDQKTPLKEIEGSILQEIFKIEMNGCITDAAEIPSDCNLVFDNFGLPDCSKELCLTAVAEKDKDPAVCRAIENVYYRKGCIYKVAKKEQNPSFCEILDNKGFVLHCRAQVGKSIEPCNGYIAEADRAVCMYHVATYAKDATLCEYLPTEENIRYFSESIKKTEWIGRTSCKESVCRYKPQDAKGCVPQ